MDEQMGLEAAAVVGGGGSGMSLFRKDVAVAVLLGSRNAAMVLRS